MTMRPLNVLRLGLIPYADGLELQQRLVEDRKADRVPDTLLLLQHPHTITVGVRPNGRRNVIATTDLLARRGVQVFETGRGGDVTYHGPGQVVGYPILNLRPDRQDVHRYVRDLEEVMIGVCGEYGVKAGRIQGLSGAWIGGAKIGAVGVRISRWVTSHGFAFNVHTDLDYFKLIVPCGIADRGVTSLQSITGREHAIEAVENQVVHHFRNVFGCMES